MSDLFPAIVAVGYNRPECMKRLVKSIENADYPAENIKLIVSIDCSDQSDRIEKIVREIGWSHGDLLIKRYTERQGLKNHILQCGDLSEEYGAVIILEDDLVVSRCFYHYVVQALRFYQNHSKIAGISLYSHKWNGYGNYEFMAQKNEYDAYLGQFSISWGQCWTRERWKEFRSWYSKKKIEGLGVNGQLPENIEHWGEKSWGKYFAYYIVEKDLYYVIPYISLSTNCSDIGEHNARLSNSYQVMLLDTHYKRYDFPNFDQAIRYDMFFERMLEPGRRILGIRGEDICFDLNGTHRDANGRKYLLTSIREPSLKLIRTCGLQMRPIEENIFREIPGNDLFLYRVPKKYKRTKKILKTSYTRISYEVYDNGWKRTFYYGIRSFFYAVKRRIGGN